MSISKAVDPLFTTTIRNIQRPSDISPLTLQSPAIEVLNDFTRQNPLMLEQNTSINEAREIMRRTHTRMFLVIDSHEMFCGVITLDDLVSEKVMKKMAVSQLRRDELTVAYVMTPRNRLRAIDLKTFQLASVGEILALMQDYGEQQMIVVDTPNASIRGYVSAHGIARRMHTPLVINERAVLFTDIFTTIAV